MSNLQLPFDEFMFEQSFYQNEIISDVKYRQKEIVEREFYNCKFLRCDFGESIFRNCYFENCSFENCDFSLVKVKHSSFSAVCFQNTRASGINWTETKIPLSVDFYASQINYSTFVGLNLKGIKIVECVAREVNFSDTNLTKADLRSTDFSGSRFINTDLTSADFSNATNYSINPAHNKLKKTKFTLPEAMSLLYGLDIILE